MNIVQFTKVIGYYLSRVYMALNIIANEYPTVGLHM